jgi:hypothetical protein
VPSAHSTVQTPRSTRVTRPGRASSGRRWLASQPRDARSNVIGINPL